MLRTRLFAILLLGTIMNIASAQKHLMIPPKMNKDFKTEDQPAAPDYSQEKHWAALPFHEDEADFFPKGEKVIDDKDKGVDVFFIYPTLYKKGETWCADVNDKKLNKKIDKKPIRYQASVFSASCRVYAPRYRQAILRAFYDSTNGPKALAFAYQDVKKAFQYYLDHYNNGRPIVIASHSQGSYHATSLLRDFFDNTPLRKQLVCAYVVGMGMNKNSYTALKPCEDEKQTGCYVTWASYKDGHTPAKTLLYDNVCVNPITWKCDTVPADFQQSQGSILLRMKHKHEHKTAARVHNNYLWVKTKMPVVKNWNVLHTLDYNLFWYDIRKNVAVRVGEYLKAKK